MKDIISPKPDKKATRWIALGTVALIFLGLAWHQHRFVDHYAVNVLFWDQWDFYLPLFNGQGLWDTFCYQHGPHRQGLGFLVARILADISGWNSRWDAFGVSFTLIGAAGLGLLVARRCGAYAGLGMASVPLLFFNLRQYEMFVGASNLSHGAMPMLLFMACCLAWFVRNDRWRLALLASLTFLLIFTGFGLFVGLIVPVLLLVEAVQTVRARHWGHAIGISAALLAIGAAWLLFARGYQFAPAVDGFRFPYEKPWEYAYFVGLMLANFFGIPGHGPGTIASGLGIGAMLIALCGWHGWQLVRHGVARSCSTVIFSLAAYALLYCANTAFGRVFLGLEQAPAASRYVTLMVPAGLAIFLQLATLPWKRLACWLTIAYAVLLVPGSCFLRSEDWSSVRWYYEGRKTWKSVYLATHDEALAARKANFLIYPSSVAGRLQYLEQHRLNLFNAEDKP